MYYFAYAANMDESRMRACASFTSREGATLPGYRLEFNKQSIADPRLGFANVVPDPDSSVEGVLYETDAAGLAKLDLSEGYPQHYIRAELEVITRKGKKVPAQVYIATEPKVRAGLRPSKTYKAHLLGGKDLLPAEYYRRLEAVETLD